MVVPCHVRYLYPNETSCDILRKSSPEKIKTHIMKKTITRLALFFAIILSSYSAFAQNYVDFATYPDSYCAPAELTVYNYSSITNYTGSPEYFWYVNGSLVSTMSDPDFSFTLAEGNNLIRLEVFDNYNDSLLGSQTYTIEIGGVISDFSLSTGQNVCPGQKITFSVPQNFYYYNLEWDFGYNDYFVNSKSYSDPGEFTYDKVGTYTVSLIVNHYCGTDTIKKTITVSNSSNPSITLSDVIVESGCVNDPVKFKMLNQFESYFWEFGDGTTSTLESPVHTYQTDIPANYTAKLTVTNKCGGSSSLVIPVSLKEGVSVNADFNYNSLFGSSCVGASIAFEAIGTGSYYWDFGDGTTSTERNPVHRFTTPYDHEVYLTVTNGCLNTNTILKNVYINDYDESYIPYPYFTFDAAIFEGMGQSDTIFVCSGQTVKFLNQSTFDLEYSYSWDFSDGTTAFGYNTSHLYTNPGVYPVILTVSNQCGSGNSNLKYVVVDDAALPKVSLKAIPTTICAGDKVYFLDNNFDPRNLYTYSIDFGDGNSISNINKIDDAIIKTLATHSYSSGGPYNYTFTATNFCGNDYVSNGTINIDNSIARKPFYYIENNTEDESLRPPSDWSVRKSPTDFEITVNVNWPAWQASYGNTIYLNLWYGVAMVNEGYVTNPSAYVKVTAADLAVGSVVKAYVPLNEGSANTVGLKAEFYCGGIARFGEASEAYGSLTNGNMIFPSIPIIPAGSTDLVADGLFISIDSYWDGLCASEKPYGRWFRLVEPGVYAVLNIWDSGDGIVYNMSYQDGIDMFSKSREFDYGYFNRIGDDANHNADSASFYSTSNTCYYDGYYQMNRLNANTLQFISYNESCPYRPVFLDGTFTKLVENPAAYSAACPGDKVQFKVVGGVSYLWNFGDGNTSTLPYPQHAYANPGTYNARVIATNSCARKDTLYTKVTVMAKPAGHTYFYIPENELFAGDSVHFSAEVMDPDAFDNKTYSWKFGDGNTSNLKNPVHVYKKTGNYKVELTTTNGCGSGTMSKDITISAKIPDCLAKFSYWSDGYTGFTDNSLGNPTSWFWDFGNGTYSTEQYPESILYDYDGVYYVTLSIFNDITNCFSSVTQKVEVGWSPCQAAFYSIINSNSGLVNFISNSQGESNYYWDFGDGDYSIEANPSHTYSKSGAYTVCLIIWDDTTFCQSIICDEILVIPTDGNYLLTDFDFYNNGADNTVVFNDLSTSVGSSWYWTMGDGKILEDQNPVYTYAKPGIYEVCLTVYDNTTLLSNSICKEVRVGAPDCNVGSYFSYFINPGLLEVSFLNKSKGSADEFFWDFGDGNSSTEANPVITFNYPGYYYITLYVRNSTDGCLDQYSEFVQVGAGNCRAGFQSRINPDNNNASFKDDSKGSIEYYYWDFGDGNYSVLQNPENLYKNSGQYLVSQTVINDLGTCMDFAADFVQVGDINCAADFKTYIDATSSTAYFTNHAMGEYTALFWSFGDGSYSTMQNPVHEFPGEGIYSAGLNTYDFNSGCMDFYEEKLLIGNIGVDCQADFVYRVDPNTSDVTFSNKSIGDIANSIWNFGDETANSDEIDPVHNFAKPGYYYVCLNVINTEGIKNIECKWVLVQANASNDCKADFMFSIDTTTKKVNFVDNSRGNIDKYSWDFGDSKSDSVSFLENPSHIYNQKGYYTVKLKVENTTSGCVSKEYKLLNVGEEMVLKASFGYEAIEQNKKVAGYPVDLVSASSGDGATVEWDFGDKQIKKGTFTTMDSTSLRVTHYYALPGKYQVCLRITDPVSGQSDTHCDWVSTKFGVYVEDDLVTDLYLNVYPNPFNDFTTINYSIAKTDNIEISVYDQLGRKIETLVKSRKEAGDYQIDWKTPTLTAGVYHLKMVTNEGTYTRQLVLTK